MNNKLASLELRVHELVQLSEVRTWRLSLSSPESRVVSIFPLSSRRMPVPPTGAWREAIVNS